MRNIMTVVGLLALVIGAVGCAQTGMGGGGKCLYRVNCGGDKDYVDKDGAVWKADQYWSSETTWGVVGGMTVHRFGLEAIEGTDAPDLYLDECNSMDAYRFKVDNGTYTLRLHFAETYDGITADGQRVFTIEVEGKPVLKDLDVYKGAGGFAKPLVKVVPNVKVEDGKIDIEFVPDIQNPEINGIEVIQP